MENKGGWLRDGVWDKLGSRAVLNPTAGGALGAGNAAGSSSAHCNSFGNMPLH